MYPQLVKTKLSDPPLLHFLVVIFDCVAWLMLPLHKCGNDNGWTRIINKMYLLIWICLIVMVLVETQTGIHNREFLVLVWFLWFYSFWNFLVKEYKLSFDTKTRSCQIWNVLIVLCVCVCVQGETSVASATSSPVWNEEISFIEQFPPLAQRIRVQILDDAKMGDIALATHFLDLQQISDPTRNGTTRSLHMLSGTKHNRCFFFFTLMVLYWTSDLTCWENQVFIWNRHLFLIV